MDASTPATDDSLPSEPFRARSARLWTSLFWTFHVVFWVTTATAAWAFLRLVQPDGTAALRGALDRLVIGTLLTGVIALVSRKTSLRHRPRPVRYAAVAAMCCAGLLTTMGLFRDQAAPLLLPRIAATVLWFLGFIGLDAIEDLSTSEARAARAEADAAALRALSRENELRHLQAQMNPHFLFNALNAVVANRHDPEAIERVTQDLSDYLRFALREARPLEPLSRELQALDKYLSVQQSRFGDRLVCRLRCDQASHGVAVPPMMIQPLLENAFTHGAPPSHGPLTVSVTAAVADERLEVEVANTGRWVVPDPSRRPSTGIRTLRARLAFLYGQDASVTTSEEDGWVRVRIRLPARGVEKPAERPA